MVYYISYCGMICKILKIVKNDIYIYIYKWLSCIIFFMTYFLLPYKHFDVTYYSPINISLQPYYRDILITQLDPYLMTKLLAVSLAMQSMCWQMYQQSLPSANSIFKIMLIACPDLHKMSKFRITVALWWESSRGYQSNRVSNSKRVSMSWCHHAVNMCP